MKKMELHLATRINTFLLFCLVVLFGTGCFKFNEPGVSQNITWKGRVLERGTNKPLAKAKIYLYSARSSGFDPLGGGSGSGSIIDSFYTAANGTYSFTYFDNIDDSYSLKGVADGYYLGESEGTLGTREDPRTDILLDPYAWIKFHVKNVNPYDDNDEIYIGSSKAIVGSRVDTTFVSQEIGNAKFSFNNWVIKNKKQLVIKDSINFLPAHDTIFHEILY